LQAWVYQPYAGTLNVNRSAGARPIINREHRLVASTVLGVADVRRRHGDLDGDVDIAAALREPPRSCALRSPTTCCMPLECSPATNTPGHADRRSAGLSASRPGRPDPTPTSPAPAHSLVLVETMVCTLAQQD